MEQKYILDLLKEVDFNLGLTENQNYIIAYKNEKVLFLDTENENLNIFSYQKYIEYLLELYFSINNLKEIIAFYNGQDSIYDNLEQFYAMRRDLKSIIEQI